MSLGSRETGSSVAAPIFRDFMARALEGQPGIPFRIPPGVRLVRVDAESGQPARPGDRKVILEAFRPGTEPSGGELAVIDGGYVPAGFGLEAGTGGLY
jgi:penicillin-binding protein 1A